MCSVDYESLFHAISKVMFTTVDLSVNLQSPVLISVYIS